jgi:hypothetical protein
VLIKTRIGREQQVRSERSSNSPGKSCLSQCSRPGLSNNCTSYAMDFPLRYWRKIWTCSDQGVYTVVQRVHSFSLLIMFELWIDHCSRFRGRWNGIVIGHMTCGWYCTVPRGKSSLCICRWGRCTPFVLDAWVAQGNFISLLDIDESVIWLNHRCLDCRESVKTSAAQGLTSLACCQVKQRRYSTISMAAPHRSARACSSTSSDVEWIWFSRLIT